MLKMSSIDEMCDRTSVKRFLEPVTGAVEAEKAVHEEDSCSRSTMSVVEYDLVF